MGDERQLLHRADVARAARRPVDHHGPAHLEVRRRRAEARRSRRQSARRSGTWTFSVDQPFNPSNLASFVPVAGLGASVRDRQPRETADVIRRTCMSNYLRRRRVEAGRRRDAEPRPSLRLSVAWLQPGADARLEGPKYGIRLSRRRARRRAWRRSSISTSAATRTTSVRASASRGTCSNDDEDRRARGLWHLLQPDEHCRSPRRRWQNFRQPTAIIANPTYPDPYGGRDPLTFVQPRRQNIAVEANDLENLAVGGLHRRHVAGAHLRARDPRRRRLQQDDEGPDGD